MYKIYFEGKPFASVSDIETACGLALSVHRSSNEPHVVTVVEVKESTSGLSRSTVISFSLTPKETK